MKKHPLAKWHKHFRMETLHTWRDGNGGRGQLLYEVDENDE